MKNILIRLVAVVAAVVLITGCETESTDQISISISPNHATLLEGESLEFTASGWRNYSWKLSDSTLGVLSATKGDRTTYTALKGLVSTNETFQQILICTVNIPVDNVNTTPTPTTTNVVSIPTVLVTAQSLITQKNILIIE